MWAMYKFEWIRLWRNKSILNVTIMMLLTGCSLQDVNIENHESTSQEISAVDESDKSSESEDVDRELRPALGEKFIPESMVKSGIGYLTVESAEIFDNLNDAGIEENQLLPYSLLDGEGEPRELEDNVNKTLSVAYDKNTGDMINGWKIVKVHYTFENQSAVSDVEDWNLLPQEVPEEQNLDDIFITGTLTICNVDNSHMNTPMNYFCCESIYFSLANSVKTTIMESDLFKCPVGEKVEFDIAYVSCFEPENLYACATTGYKASTMVDLKLGGDS